MFDIFSSFNSAARLIRLEPTVDRFDFCVVDAVVVRPVVARATAGVRVAETAVVVRALTFWAGATGVRVDTVRAVVGWVAVRAFLFCVESDFREVVADVREEEVVIVVFAPVRFDAARAASESTANVVWDTDKPRHTAKNSIILFIP